jgi:hypothetical protein
MDPLGLLVIAIAVLMVLVLAAPDLATDEQSRRRSRRAR